MDSNNNTGTAGSSDDINNPDSYSNRIALAAIAFAVAALLAAALQVILEYVSSSAVRHKVAPSAIHVAADRVKKKWSWTGWKRKFYYPQVSFDATDILSSLVRDEIESIEGTVLQQLAASDTRTWGFRGIKTEDVITRSHVCDGVTAMLFRPEGAQLKRPATTSDLPWKYWFQWHWWRFRNPPQVVRRPRASWAQIFRAFGFRDMKRLTLRHIDADSIPTYIDVPIQRAKLFDMGILALSLGFTSVHIDTANRDFRALGPFATITVEDLPNFGKVLRFEGDMLAIHTTVRRCSAMWLRIAAIQLNGKLLFGKLMASGTVVLLDVLVKALFEGWSTRTYQAAVDEIVRKETHESLMAGHLPREAATMNDFVSDSLKDEISMFLGPGRTNSVSTDIKLWKLEKKYGDIRPKLRELVNERFDDYEEALKSAFARWQARMNIRIPTILAITTFASITNIANGFPSTIMLGPYAELFRLMANDLVKRAGETFKVSSKLQTAIADGSIPYLTEDSRFLMSVGTGGSGGSVSGHYSWGAFPLRDLFLPLPEDIREEMIPARNGTIDPGEMNGLVMPQTMRLLESFQPHTWAKFNDETKDYLGTGKSFRTENFLWMQVIILDIAIRLLIRGSVSQLETVYRPRPLQEPTPQEVEDETLVETLTRWKKQPSLGWDAPELLVLGCIHQSAALSGGPAEPITPASSKVKTQSRPEMYEDWDLLGTLQKNSGLPQNTEKEKLRVRKLADLLKLRALFLVAFLMLNPDSSDVYRAENSEVEMPII